MRVRKASSEDVPGIAGIHVRSWRVAYRGILSDELLDSLSVPEREESWRALLASGPDSTNASDSPSSGASKSARSEAAGESSGSALP